MRWRRPARLARAVACCTIAGSSTLGRPRGSGRWCHLNSLAHQLVPHRRALALRVDPAHAHVRDRKTHLHRAAAVLAVAPVCTQDEGGLELAQLRRPPTHHHAALGCHAPLPGPRSIPTAVDHGMGTLAVHRRHHMGVVRPLTAPLALLEALSLIHI
eukprot:15459662-Alexandrium_andersonii.AAC.1